jgi:hypothetical protein
MEVGSQLIAAVHLNAFNKVKGIKSYEQQVAELCDKVFL